PLPAGHRHGAGGFEGRQHERVPPILLGAGAGQDGEARRGDSGVRDGARRSRLRRVGEAGAGAPAPDREASQDEGAGKLNGDQRAHGAYFREQYRNQGGSMHGVRNSWFGMVAAVGILASSSAL